MGSELGAKTCVWPSALSLQVDWMSKPPSFLVQVSTRLGQSSFMRIIAAWIQSLFSVQGATRAILRGSMIRFNLCQTYPNSGNALEPSNALNYSVWGIPAVLSRGIPGNALRAFPGSFRNFSGISSGKSQPYWGYGPFWGAVFLSSKETYAGAEAVSDCWSDWQHQ